MLLLLFILYMGDNMNVEEKVIRRDIVFKDKRIGNISIRYPDFGDECKRINRFYSKLVQRYITYIEKNMPRFWQKAPAFYSAVLVCRADHISNEYVSVGTEARLYEDNEAVRRYRSSLVWQLKKCRLEYIRRSGIRRTDITYNGREFKLFKM